MNVSVIIATHKRDKMLMRALKSVIEQSYSPYEVFVVDDTSSKSTEECVMQVSMHSPVRVVYVSNPNPIGIGAGSLNLASKKVKSSHIAFLDDDDYWHKDYLENALSLMAKENVEIVLAAKFNVNEKGVLTPGKTPPERFVKEEWLLRNPGCAVSNLVLKKECFCNIGGYDTGCIASADRDLFIRLMKRGYKYAVLKDRLLYHSNYGHRDTIQLGKMLESNLRLYMKYFRELSFVLHLRILKKMASLAYRALLQSKMICKYRLNKPVEVFKTIYTHFYGYRLPFLKVVSLSVLFSVVETCGIATFLPLYENFISQKGEESLSAFTIGFNNTLSFFNIPVTLVSLLFITFFMFLMRGCFELGSKYYQARVTRTYESNARDRLFNNILNLKWEFYIQQKKGYLLNLITFHITRARSFFESICDAVVAIIAVIIYLGGVMAISRFVALGGVVGGAILFVIIIPFVKRTKKYSWLESSMYNSIAENSHQFLNGFKQIKTTNTMKNVFQSVSADGRKLLSYGVMVHMIKSLSSVWGQIFGLVIIGSFIYIFHVLLNEGLAAIGVSVLLFWKVFTRINSIQAQLYKTIQQYPSISIISSGINKFFEEREEIEANNQVLLFNENISIKNLEFRYSMSQNVPTLYNINMKIQKGEMVGIVGPSGAGKTTLVDILLGVLKFEAGEVLLDNTPLSVNNIWAWREIVGYVPQDGFLLNDNVRNNIKFFKDIPDPDIISAAKFADADGFINEMTNGYDSILGDNGINLSGGQRQRIVLARALAGNPQILILDEATSSLDTESENKIQLAIEKLRNKLTIIVIAHRLSTILNADNIFVLKDGRIVEEGASSELIDNGKTFYKLYMKQGFEKNEL